MVRRYGFQIFGVSTDVSYIALYMYINSFPASGDFCRLLITFANSLDPDQARQIVKLDLEPNCLTL